jgi:hypothetical protein
MSHSTTCTCARCTTNVVVAVKPPIVVTVTPPSVRPNNPTNIIVGPGQGGGIGPAGPQGPQGPAGAPATVDNMAYVHNQGNASDTWVITHNLNFYPNVTIQDSGGTIVEGEIAYTTRNTLTVTFSAAFSGKAYLS